MEYGWVVCVKHYGVWLVVCVKHYGVWLGRIAPPLISNLDTKSSDQLALRPVRFVPCEMLVEFRCPSG